MAIVQFVLDPEQAIVTAGHTIERGTTLFSPPVNGQSCRFRTCYPVTLWPIEVTAAQLDTTGAASGWPARRRRGAPARADAAPGGASIADLELDRLRFFICTARAA